MKFHVEHQPTQYSFGRLGSGNCTVWHDLATLTGAIRRARRNWPTEKIRIEVLDPINIYRPPVRVIEVYP